MNPPRHLPSRAGFRRGLCALSVAAVAVTGAGLHLHAQADPTASTVGTVGPSASMFGVPGELNYSLSATDSLLFGYYTSGGAADSIGLSGTASFVSDSVEYPTSFVYEGGYYFGNGGIPSQFFQNFAISQVVNRRKWNATVEDSVSYLPNAPAFGLGGIPGLGDIGTLPVTTPGQTSGLLTNYGTDLINTSSAGAGYRMTGKTSLNASGSYSMQRFVNNPAGVNQFGVNSNSAAGTVELNHTINVRNSFGVDGTYTRFLYPGTGFSFNSESAMGVYQHGFTRSLTMTAEIGPEWTQSSRPAFVPDMTSVAANISAVYTRERSSASVSFFRGTNSGSGVLLGAVSNDASFTASHDFTRQWNGSFTTNFDKSTGLEIYSAQRVSINALTLGVQARRRIGREWSAFGAYSLEYQNLNSPPSLNQYAVNAFSGTSSIISLGITYSPKPLHLGHH